MVNPNGTEIVVNIRVHKTMLCRPHLLRESLQLVCSYDTLRIMDGEVLQY